MTNRRSFIKLSAAAAAFLGLPHSESYSSDQVERRLNEMSASPSSAASMAGFADAPIENVRVGFIGLGMRGPNHMSHVNALKNKATIVAICDIRESRVEEAMKFASNQKKKPDVYAGTDDAWKKMLDRDDLDLVIISTPWTDHVPMAVEAMRKGKHVAVEVPAALTLQGAWDLVNTSEETRRHCMMMENVCYGDEELWILNMVNKGMFGTLTYAEAAYIHDLRSLMYSQEGYYNQWRIRHHVEQDGNLYPTHGLGPVAQYLGIGRGDRFQKLVSMSSLEAGLSAYGSQVDPSNEFYNASKFAHGDMNNTLIKTALGRTILVQHDVVTPRPYSRINALAGTKGYHEGYPSRLALEEKGGHRWLDEESYKEIRSAYRHPIWDRLKKEIEENGGHGGMDFVQIYRLLDCLNRGLPLDMDVYDAADWSVVVGLSRMSVELGNVPVEFPDFIRGKWNDQRELGIMANL